MKLIPHPQNLHPETTTKSDAEEPTKPTSGHPTNGLSH
jgi:hypothetical protein